MSYLQYWHEPAYACSLTQPHALYFLDLLQVAAFRHALLNPAYITLLHEQQFWQWKSGRYNAFRDAEQRRERASANQAQEQEAQHKRTTQVQS